MSGARDCAGTERCGRHERVSRARRPTPALVALGVLGVLVARGAGALELLPEAIHMEWSGGLDSRTLDDGSVLSEYVSRTTGAPEEPDVALSVGFVPRFDCSPLIGIRVVGALSADVGATLGDGDRVTLTIDDEASELAVLVDADERTTTLWFDDAVDDRERLRRLIDSGSRAELALPDDNVVAFSLLGSRRSAAATEVACRKHEPLPYENE